ncbi:MAG TPA: TIGR03118 family protein [Gemmatimonadales bacterium]|nr:TIGR03118 family protein [Gemmatimonadales bacterium]
MSTRALLRAPPLFCAALFVACAEERIAAPPLTPPSFSLQGKPAAPPASRFYQQHNLVSDGAVPADLVDPNLVNAWGLVSGPATPWWISDNGTGRSTLYSVSTGAIPLIVTVPGVGGEQSAPTGLVFNGGTGFVVTNSAGTSPARFIFASEDGTISGFRGVPVVIAVDSSASGAVYKGLAIASTATGDFLYATNFHAGTVEVFDSHFNPVHVTGAFTDPGLPAGYAPFGIQNIGGTIYVTYALQDADKHDDVSGEGHGFVNAFDTGGNLIRRVASKGELNSPWGLALAPADFGTFSNDLLVGNFGNGRVHAFDPGSLEGNGAFQHRGPLHSAEGPPIAIDGLWALSFGKGAANNGPTNTLFFTAGPDGEQNGLFGMLVVAPRGRER